MKRTLLTIVTEGVIERAVVEDLKRLGAHGYTVVEARGEGARGVRAADWEHSSNVRIETICERGVAETILEHLTRVYYANYAMIAYLSEVEVVRGEKF
jgi:nitrogen regulatory protein P-II 2